MIKTNNPIPPFSLKNQNGDTVSQQDLKGQWWVLYIYPKDDTPGCTIELNDFSDKSNVYKDSGIQVYGLSPDDVNSHLDFCNKFNASIDLLADPKEELLNKLNPGQVEYNGVNYWKRTTYIIDPEGIVKKIYNDVDVKDHAQIVLDDIKNLKG